MSTKLTTKKGSRTAAADVTKPAAGKKSAAKKVAAKAKQSRPKTNADTRVTTEDNLTVVEVPQATAETIDGKPAKSERGKKTNSEKPARTSNPKFETENKVSQIDAALKVLGESSESLTTKQMVEAMAAKNYWASPGGKTPHATLYSAILRELQTKGDESRFVKTDRGHFRLRTA